MKYVQCIIPDSVTFLIFVRRYEFKQYKKSLQLPANFFASGTLNDYSVAH